MVDGVNVGGTDGGDGGDQIQKESLKLFRLG